MCVEDDNCEAKRLSDDFRTFVCHTTSLLLWVFKSNILNLITFQCFEIESVRMAGSIKMEAKKEKVVTGSSQILDKLPTVLYFVIHHTVEHVIFKHKNILNAL